MKYKYEHMAMKNIGKLFGVTSHEIGKWLVKLGLREIDGKPSHQAHSEKLVEQSYYNGCYTYHWHTEKTIAVLVKAGHELIPNPPDEFIAEYNEIIPPFTLRRNDRNGYDVLNNDGLIILTISGERNSKRMEKFLNITSGHPKFFEFFPKDS